MRGILGAKRRLVGREALGNKELFAPTEGDGGAAFAKGEAGFRWDTWASEASTEAFGSDGQRRCQAAVGWCNQISSETDRFGRLSALIPPVTPKPLKTCGRRRTSPNHRRTLG